MGKSKSFSDLTAQLSPLVLFKCPVPILSQNKTNYYTCLNKVHKKYKWMSKHLYKKLSQINQSILTKAFVVNLFPKNPSDEPASVLLERIKAEREAGTAKKSKTSKSSTLGHKSVWCITFSIQMEDVMNDVNHRKFQTEKENDLTVLGWWIKKVYKFPIILKNC